MGDRHLWRFHRAVAMTGLLAAVGLCLVVVIGLVPLVLPWPVRLRWIIITATADPWTAGSSALALEECRIEAVQVTGTGPVMIACKDGAATELLQVPAVSLADRDQLERWRATRTPLLKDGRAGGAVTLSGPSASITAFRQIDRDAFLSAEGEDLSLGELTLDDLILLGRL
jgi:hypothetical protein